MIGAFSELVDRIVLSHQSEKQREDLSTSIAGSKVWNIIRLIRVLFKKRHLIACNNRTHISRLALEVFQAVEGVNLEFLGRYLDEFVVIRKESKLFSLIQANPELSNNIRTEKDFFLYSMNQENDVYLLRADQFNNLAFNVCLSELLSLYKVKNQNEIIRLDILSGLSSGEKTAVKFNKIYTKKSDEILLMFDFEGHSSALLEDYIYTRISAQLGKSEKESSNFFVVYQFYDLLTRDSRSSSLIAALIRSKVKKLKRNRVFFLLEEADLLAREGQLGKAYYKMRDLHDYCIEKDIHMNKSATVFVMMKELFFLLWAHASVVPKPGEETYFSFVDSICWPQYYREQIRRLEWIVERGGNFYMVENKFSTDSLDEIAHNLKDKLEYLLSEEPSSLYQVSGDLEAFYKGLFHFQGTKTGSVNLLRNRIICEGVQIRRESSNRV